MSAHSWRCELRLCALSARPGFSVAVVVSTAQGGQSGGRELQTPAREHRYNTQSLRLHLCRCFFPFSVSSLYGHTFYILHLVWFLLKKNTSQSLYLNRTAVCDSSVSRNMCTSDLFAHTLVQHRATEEGESVTTDCNRSTLWCFLCAKLLALHFPCAPFALFTFSSVFVLLVLHLGMLTTISVLGENLLIPLSYLFCIF